MGLYYIFRGNQANAQMDASPPSWQSQASFVVLCTNCRHAAAVRFLALTHFPQRSVTSLNETSLFFSFLFKGCICATERTCLPSILLTCARRYACALGALFMKVLPLIAHSAATCAVQSRPNFSIRKHKRKLTLLLRLFFLLCHTDGRSFTETRTGLETHSEAACDGCRWPFLEVF